MKIKTTFLIIGLTIFSFFLAKSQALKTYSGSFESGKATYHYYENEKYDRVFHGQFSYNGSIYNMKGNFVNGKKNGTWNIFATNKLFSIGNLDIIVNTKVSGNYKKGALNGPWFFSNATKTKTKADDRTISTANFNNNHFVGKVTYESIWPQKYYVEGQFNSLGFLTGSWKYVKDDVKDVIKYFNGVAYWRLVQNITNGEKIVFCDSTSFVKKFWTSYDSVTQTSNVYGKMYCLDTIEISPDRRVSKSEVIDIKNPSAPIDYNYNPICLWSGQSRSEFYLASIKNPLYYYSKGSIAPKGFEIVIKECEHSNDMYLYKRSVKVSTIQGIMGRQEVQGVADSKKYKGNTGNETGGGTGNGNTPGIGSGTGSGISYDLSGRSVRSLPKPSYNSAQQGRVVVTIGVNREGRVTRVISGAKGTTVTDPSLIRQAESAARQALFFANPNGPDEQVGKIIYNFIKLN